MRCLLIASLIAVVAGCGGGEEPEPLNFTPQRPKLLTTGAPIGDVKIYARGILKVGIDVYQHLDRQEENIVFSPMGIHTSVAVLTHGMERPVRA